MPLKVAIEQTTGSIIASLDYYNALRERYERAELERSAQLVDDIISALDRLLIYQQGAEV